MIFVCCVLFAAMAFTYINGFHDTANSIATVVSTKVLSPRQAILLAAAFNLFGAFTGTAVAETICNGLVDSRFVTLPAILAALIAAVGWGVLTWWLGLPSSSSHALIGGLCGATLASAHGQWSVIKWSVVNTTTLKPEGIWPKVIVPMLASPVIGFVLGFLFMGLLVLLLRGLTPHFINRVFGRLQLASASYMGFSHGTNDAQKTMGVITLTLFTATQAGTFQHLPGWLSFLHTPTFKVELWIKVLCAVTMAVGTAAGGWRIIRTLGHKMVKLQPIHGFAAETTAASLIHVASTMGIPLSTTHVISSAIMGVGATKRFSAVKWGVVEQMVWAWVLTLPLTAFVSYWLMVMLRPWQ